MWSSAPIDENIDATPTSPVYPLRDWQVLDPRGRITRRLEDRERV